MISIANGTYDGAASISRSGTAANPIIITGESVRGVVINASGADAGISIRASHVYVEDLTVRGSHWGMQVPDDADDVVIRSGHVRVKAPWGSEVPVQLHIEVTGKVGSGHLVARPRSRNFWQWLTRQPKPYMIAAR